MKKTSLMLICFLTISLCCGCGADATAVVPTNGTLHTVEGFGDGAWSGLSDDNDLSDDEGDGTWSGLPGSDLQGDDNVGSDQQGGTGVEDNPQNDGSAGNGLSGDEGIGAEGANGTEAADTLAQPESESGGDTVNAENTDAENVGTENVDMDAVSAGTPTPPDPTVTITISAAGDVTLGNHQNQEYGYSFRETYDNEGDEYFFRNVKYLFEADDMTIVNFEGVLTFSEEMLEKEYNMKGDPSYINILTEGSVEAVSFANNHRLDYLEQGSKDTVAAFEEADITYAYDSYVGVYETEGIRIGIVSVNEVSQGAYVEKYLEEGIALLREEEEADLVVACCHWGVERENYPEDYQKQLGRKCIDWGADLVLGAHPHVLQGIEVYEGKFIVYSLGNFCFGGNRNPADKDTMIFQQTFTFTDGVQQENTVARVIPCSVSSVSNRNDFCPTPAEGDEYTRILDRINEYSEPFGVMFGEDGFYTESVQ